MALKPGLRVRQIQHLALTPGLRQSLSILRMSAGELEQYVQDEIDQNPLLKAEFKTHPGAAPDYQFALDTVAELQTSGQLLRDQITLMSAPDTVRNIALFLTEDITPEGYLSDNVDDIATHLGVNVTLVDDAVTLLQSCDPVGIGAKDLRDCLDLQLKEVGETPRTRAFILENLSLFGDRDWGALRRISGLNPPELTRLSKLLRSLDPCPAQALVPDVAPPLIPDIKVVAQSGGGFSLSLIGSTFPDLTVNHTLSKKLGEKSVEAASYVQENVARATTLVRAIEARSKTILRVATEIVLRQHRFFSWGPTYLCPLTQRQTAQELGLHASTVNRAIADKALECDFGVFPLNFFFTNSVNSVEKGEEFSAHVVRLKVRKIVDDESPDDVLSDERISALLRQSGVDIARRTVAKYRQCLNIPSSSQRRKSKRTL